MAVLCQWMEKSRPEAEGQERKPGAWDLTQACMRACERTFRFTGGEVSQGALAFPPAGSGTLKTKPAVPSSHLTVLSIHLCANPSAQNSFVFKGLFTRCQSHCSGPGWVASWLPVVLTFGRHPSCTCGSLGAAVRACEKKPGDVGGQRGRHRASVSHFTSPQAVREPSSCAVPCPVWPGGEGCVCVLSG